MDYKKILKGIVQIINTTEKSDIGFANICTYIGENCPELAESEDEKVRKELIKHLKDGVEGYMPAGDSSDYQRWLDWVEKQKPIEHFELKEGHWYVCHRAFCCRADHLTIKEGEKFMCEKDGVAKGFIIKDPEKYFKETVPLHLMRIIDKVKPKFHEGDWVVISTSDDRKIVQVVSIEYFSSGQPRYITSEGRWFGNGTKAHLWTIQDAKSGDVLVYNNGSVEIILLFEKWMNGVGEGAYSYAHTFYDEILFNDWSDCGYSTHPATKEQRDQLEKAMFDAGYKWNKEELKLEKI